MTPQDEEVDDSLDLVYLRERYYDTDKGRFLSLDPVEGAMSDPMSLNRYAYVHDDPVNRTDPSGRTPVGSAALPNMLNAGFCPAPAQAQNVDCSCHGIFAWACQQGILPPCSAPQPLAPTNTPQPTQTPTPNPTPTDSPNVNPCTTRNVFPVFGSCSDDKCIPHFAGSGYNPDGHRAVDIVPIGAFESYPSTYLAPDWSTRPQTEAYNPVYAVTDGTVVYPLDPDVPDAIALRLSDTWEFVYIHIIPSVKSGSVTAGTKLGVIIPHSQASSKYEKSDEDHLHFGLRNPSRTTQSLDPAPCLPGLTG